MRSRSAAPPPQPSPPRQRRRRRSARGTARPASGAGTPPAGTASSRSSHDTAGPAYPQAGSRGEPHRTHVPIPAAQGGTVNDADTLTMVVLPAQAPRLAAALTDRGGHAGPAHWRGNRAANTRRRLWCRRPEPDPSSPTPWPTRHPAVRHGPSEAGCWHPFGSAGSSLRASSQASSPKGAATRCNWVQNTVIQPPFQWSRTQILEMS